MSTSYLLLGSNKGNKITNIQQAATMLSSHSSIKLLETSMFYETEPYKKMDTNWFVNAAIKIETTLTPMELLRVCQDIEQKLGRDRENEKRWMERTIDIDIIFYDDLIFKNDFLEIPHYLVHKRAFALVPLMEIDENIIHPVFKKTISKLHEELEAPEDVFLYGTVVGDDYNE